MILSDKVRTLILEFVDNSSVKALEQFTNTQDMNGVDVDTIASMFGYSGNFSSIMEDEAKLIKSFKNNLKLLIQKTWIEESDVALKEEVLFQLEKLCQESNSWYKAYNDFLSIISNAVYLMFGHQTKTDEFNEYSLRIDPEFGIFWFYIKELPPKAEWSDEKCRTAVLLGMYFLANY